jgi:hypothetical protein
MHPKIATLNLLPCVVSIASLLVAAHHLAPSIKAFLDASEKRAIISHQVANRSLKKNRLPKPDTEQRVPNRKIETDCKPPIDVPGRCFA